MVMTGLPAQVPLRPALVVHFALAGTCSFPNKTMFRPARPREGGFCHRDQDRRGLCQVSGGCLAGVSHGSQGFVMVMLSGHFLVSAGRLLPTFCHLTLPAPVLECREQISVGGRRIAAPEVTGGEWGHESRGDDDHTGGG